MIKVEILPPEPQDPMVQITLPRSVGRKLRVVLGNTSNSTLGPELVTLWEQLGQLGAVAR